MNQRETQIKRNDTQRLFHTPSARHKPRERGAVFISTANSIEHEIAKLKLCYWLSEHGSQFITEAHEISTGKRRDVVCLDSGVVYEVEKTPERAERFKDEPNTVVVKLWESEEK